MPYFVYNVFENKGGSFLFRCFSLFTLSGLGMVHLRISVKLCPLALEKNISWSFKWIFVWQEIKYDIFDHEFTLFMDKLMNKGNAVLVVVVGDINVWIDVKDNSDAIRLKTLMSAYGLSQMDTEKTHRWSHILD